jgi:predicted transcriptional regulator
MKTTQLVTLSLSPDVRAALDEIARREERSRSWLANRLLRESVAVRLAMQQAALDGSSPE